MHFCFICCLFFFVFLYVLFVFSSLFRITFKLLTLWAFDLLLSFCWFLKLLFLHFFALIKLFWIHYVNCDFRIYLFIYTYINFRVSLTLLNTHMMPHHHHHHHNYTTCSYLICMFFLFDFSSYFLLFNWIHLKTQAWNFIWNFLFIKILWETALAYPFYPPILSPSTALNVSI